MIGEVIKDTNKSNKNFPPIIIFERKKKIYKPKTKTFIKKTLKSKNHKDKKSSKTQNKEKLPDPLSPFAILKAIKIKK